MKPRSLANNLRLYDDEVLSVYDHKGVFLGKKLVSDLSHVPIGILSNCVYEYISYQGFFYTVNDEPFSVVLENSVLSYVLIPEDLVPSPIEDSEFSNNPYKYEGFIIGTRTFIRDFLGLSNLSDVVRNHNKYISGYYVVLLEHPWVERQLRGKILSYKKGRKDIQSSVVSGKRNKANK